MTAGSTPPEGSRQPGRDEKPWPELAGEDRWAIELMEDLLESSEQEPDELRIRAAELRKAAEEGDPGQRAAALALADRYDQAAASRHTHR